MVRNSEMPEMGEFARAYARAVRAAVDAAGLSGSEVARRLGRAQSYASVRLQGRKAWTLDELDDIAHILGMEPEDLLDRARRS